MNGNLVRESDMKMVMLLVAMGCVLVAPLGAQIKVGDYLQIYIRGVPACEKPKVEGQFVVGETGTIKIPLADVSVMAKGLSAEKLARKIEAVFREAEIYTRPNIEVITADAPLKSGAQVSVGGEVERSGPVAYRPGMTLVQAIHAAGGIGTFGSKKRVFVTRGKKRWTIDLRTAEGQRFPLMNGDTIEVDATKW